MSQFIVDKCGSPEESYLTGLCKAHSHSEAGRHAWRKGGGQRAAEDWINQLDTFNHGLYYQLTAELLNATNLLTRFSVGQTLNVLNHQPLRLFYLVRL